MLESVNDGGVLGQFGTDHLESNHAIQGKVFCLVDRTHAAFSERLLDLVTPRENFALLHDRLRQPSRSGGGAASEGRRSYTFGQRRSVEG